MRDFIIAKNLFIAIFAIIKAIDNKLNFCNGQQLYIAMTPILFQLNMLKLWHLFSNSLVFLFDKSYHSKNRAQQYQTFAWMATIHRQGSSTHSVICISTITFVNIKQLHEWPKYFKIRFSILKKKTTSIIWISFDFSTMPFFSFLTILKQLLQ